jgi:hypothetical protein
MDYYLQNMEHTKIRRPRGKHGVIKNEREEEERPEQKQLLHTGQGKEEAEEEKNLRSSGAT